MGIYNLVCEWIMKCKYKLSMKYGLYVINYKIHQTAET